MAKLLKIVRKTSGAIIEWLFVLIIFLAFAVRTSTFQTKLGELATDFLSKEMHANINIGKIDFSFFNKLTLSNVLIVDPKGDTLASLKFIDIRLGIMDLEANKIVINSIGLREGKLGINRAAKTGDYNYWFLTDYFDGGPKKTRKKTESSVKIKAVHLHDVTISYDDNRKEKSVYGFDYDHLYFRKVDMLARDFKITDNRFEFNLVQLSLTEKSGLDLTNLKMYCAFDQKKGILISKLNLITPKTQLYAKRFYMRSASFEGFQSFEDSVTLSAIIDSSRINLSDLSLFAHDLKGMDQQVALSGEFQGKVKNLQMKTIDLRFGKKSIVLGDFSLPDFRKMKGAYFKENVKYALIDFYDLEQLKLPVSQTERFIQLDENLKRLGYIELKKTNVKGTTDYFIASSNQITTKLGTLHVNNGIAFNSLKEGGYSFQRTTNSDFDIYIDSFQLGQFLDNDMLGKVNGDLFLSGVVGQKDVIRIQELDGKINSFGFNDYRYSNIVIHNGSLVDLKFKAEIEIDDPNLKLAYVGEIDLNKQQHFDFKVDIPQADLRALHFVNEPIAQLKGNFKMNITGTDLSNYSGTIGIESAQFIQNKDKIDVPKMDLNIVRGASVDQYNLTSEIADLEIVGKIDPSTLPASLQNCFSNLLPTYISKSTQLFKKPDTNKFDFVVKVKDAADLLEIYVPELSLAPGTVISGNYNAQRREQTCNVTSPKIGFITLNADTTQENTVRYLTNVKLNETYLAGQFSAQLNSDFGYLTDSLNVQKIDVLTTGEAGAFKSKVGWNEGLKNPALFTFNTNLKTNSVVDVVLKPSFFSVKGELWEIMNTAEIVYADKRVVIDHLVIERDVQFLSVNGVLSNNPEDQVVIDMNALQIDEFSAFIKEDMNIKGTLNGKVKISTPFTNFNLDGSVDAFGLFINQQEIGDVHLNGIWDPTKERVVLDGDLKYLKNETFDFSGFYYPNKSDNNIDFNLDFREMDIQFANAFMDPSVLSDIRGKLKGTILVKGSVSNPIINGDLRLSSGNVKVGILGVNYRLSGPIKFDGLNSGIYVNLPVKDEDGNNGHVAASIFHQEFANWNVNMDFVFDESVERDYGLNYTGKFMVLNTKYKEGEIYYGKAYASGNANISIEEGHTEVTVYATTEKGTNVDIPLYGTSDVSEYDFITFENVNAAPVKRKIDLTGVDLSLNITATPDANIKLIFNDKTGDQILANGYGNIEITADNFGQIRMSGQYLINQGKYNFVLGPVRQEFKLEPGGSITWTGNPYDANLNLRTYNSVNASLSEIAGTDLAGNAKEAKQEVRCILDITQTLNEPLINLDIEVPKANEAGRAVLASIRSNKDELQKQFFTLLVLKRFAPLSGQSSQSLGGVADVLTEQINSALDQMSKAVKLNVGYDGDATTGNRNFEFGMQTAIGDKKNIILKGSFGVATTAAGETSSSSNSLIGDMSLDYLINEDGTFRVTIFNESNETGVIANKDKGPFSQGIGIHYQEDFNTLQESRIVQTINRMFGKKNKKPIKNKKKKTVSVNEVILPPESSVKEEEKPIVNPE